MGLGALSCHAPGPISPETPKAGVPAIEFELLTHQYRLGEDPCTRTAEEVVDMQRRCSEAHWADCVYAATMYWHGCGVAQNLTLAGQLYLRACSFGSMLGCSMAGHLTSDHERALALLETPCARGYAPACGNIGVFLYLRGGEADVPRATQLLKAACRADDVAYCTSFAQLVIKWKLAALYQDAQTQLERACHAQDQDSCQLLASAYDQGLLGVTDPERAMAIYAISCNQDHLPSCDAMGHLFVLGRGHEKDEQKGLSIFYGTCALGYGPACESMGQATENGWGTPADSAKAVPYYVRACTLGCEHACQRAHELGAKK
jgi:TPR repeat protein